ncbi:MAG: hypothetical protein IKE14_03885 [Loktanella sp.]|nr:hypothetical protein [Loktanella sp.]
MNKIVSTDFITDDVQRLVPVDATATTPKNAAVAKLMKAWEAKTTQRAAKGAGFTLMAVSLAACNDDDAPVVGGTPLPPAQTVVEPFKLTTDFDGGADFTGGPGDDTFNARLDGGDQTLNSFDELDGGAGTDTLNVTMEGGANVAPTISNIEIFNVRLLDGAATLDFENIEGATQIWSDRSQDGTLTANNVQEAVTVGLRSVAGDTTFTVNYDEDALDSDEFAQSLVIIDSGDEDDAATVDVVADGEGDDVITGLNISATGDNFIALGAGFADVEDLTITGSGEMDLDVAALGALETVTASGYSGDLTLDVSGLADIESVVTGAGDDTVTITAARLVEGADLTINLGAGDNTLRLDGNEATAATAAEIVLDFDVGDFAFDAVITVTGTIVIGDEAINLATLGDAGQFDNLVALAGALNVLDGITAVADVDGVLTITTVATGDDALLALTAFVATDAADEPVTTDFDSVLIENGTDAFSGVLSSVFTDDDLSITGVDTLAIVSALTLDGDVTLDLDGIEPTTIVFEGAVDLGENTLTLDNTAASLTIVTESTFVNGTFDFGDAVESLVINAEDNFGDGEDGVIIAGEAIESFTINAEANAIFEIGADMEELASVTINTTGDEAFVTATINGGFDEDDEGYSLSTLTLVDDSDDGDADFGISLNDTVSLSTINVVIGQASPNFNIDASDANFDGSVKVNITFLLDDDGETEGSFEYLTNEDNGVRETFVFTGSEIGDVTIDGFVAGDGLTADKLDFSQFSGVSALGDLNVVTAGDDTVITSDAFEGTITVEGATLTADNFIF